MEKRWKHIHFQLTQNIMECPIFVGFFKPKQHLWCICFNLTTLTLDTLKVTTNREIFNLYGFTSQIHCKKESLISICFGFTSIHMYAYGVEQRSIILNFPSYLNSTTHFCFIFTDCVYLQLLLHPESSLGGLRVLCKISQSIFPASLSFHIASQYLVPKYSILELLSIFMFCHVHDNDLSLYLLPRFTF